MKHVAEDAFLKPIIFNFYRLKAFYFFLFILLPFIPTKNLLAQGNIPIGTWRTHLSYQNLEHLAVAQDKIYAAGNNSFLVFDKDDNSITRLSKITGFSEADVTSLVYDQNRDILFVGYRNGNIDMVKDGSVYNDPTFKNAQISRSKKINDFTFYNHLVFISSDYGVLVYDFDRKELREIYSELGRSGSPIRIHSGLIFNDSLFLATETGVMAGSLDVYTNLMDFANWKRFTVSNGIPEVPAYGLASFQDKLYTGVNQQGIYVYDQGVWNLSSLSTEAQVNAINRSGTSLLASLSDGIYVSTNGTTFDRIETNQVMIPHQAFSDSEGILWVADGGNGLVSNLEGDFKSYSPSGPSSNTNWSLHYFQDHVISVPGGYQSNFLPLQNQSGFSRFNSGQWASYNPGIRDLVDIVTVPQNDRIYFASFGEGLIEWIPSEDRFQLFNSQSPGSTLQSSGRNSSFTLVTSVEADIAGNLWCTNYDTNFPLQRLTLEGSWEAFTFSYSNSRYPLGLTISANNDKWISLQTERGSEILVFNESSGVSRVLSSASNNGGLPGNVVTDIAQDHDGYMWVGTDKGIAYIFNPFSVLNNESINAIIPIYNNGFLLRDEHVTAIKIDGGNRKWVGTTQGLWLFEDAGEELVGHFTIENSPLPSSVILDVEIDESTGEVFISTDKGLISFRGTATRAAEVHQNVKIFPNPVKGSFTGMMGISGLANNANVKITDVGGRLVRQLFAEGGTAVWDVNDSRGKRVRSGIYLVLSATENGEESFVGKFAVIE